MDMNELLNILQEVKKYNNPELDRMLLDLFVEICVLIKKPNLKKKKKKNHFVSQFYLNSWINDNDKVATNINKEAIELRTKELANSNYLYRVEDLAERERNILIKLNSTLQSPDVKDYIDDIINRLFLINIISMNIKNDKLKELCEIYKSNTIEDFYCIIEETAIDAFQKLLTQEYEKFDLYKYNDILRFSVFQLTRTLKVKEKLKGIMGSLLSENGLKFNEYNIISSLILSEKITLALIEKLYKITVLENKTTENFITSDHPVKNLKNIDDTEVKFFLPISPKLAIIISQANLPKEEKKLIKKEYLENKRMLKQYFLTIKEVTKNRIIEKLNVITFDNKNKYIYAKDKSDITKFIT